MSLIRPATVRDIPEISRIHARSWRSAYASILPKAFLSSLPDSQWEPFFQHNLGRGGFRVYLSILNSIPVGVVSFGAVRSTIPDARKEENWGEIYSLYILPDYTGQGQGKALLHHALGQLQKAGVAGCSLWVMQENREARGFFHKMGFFNDIIPSTFTLMGNEYTNLRYSMAFSHNDPFPSE